MKRVQPAATYLSGPTKRAVRNAKPFRIIFSLSGLFLVALVFTISLGLSPSVVLADTNNPDGSFNSSGISSTLQGSNPDDLNTYLNQYQNESLGKDTFQYVLARVFTPQYINYLPDATIASNVSSAASAIGYSPNGGTGSSNYICNTNTVGAGTPIYHNCDVPNFMGEFIQNLYSLFDRSGAQNATAVNASSILLPGFGQSKNLPGGSVPESPSSSTAKYTALEVYGYNLQVSSYLGEWDHINTLTTSRMLTNFSFFDSVSLTAKTIGDAIGGAFNVAGSMAATGWNTGGIFGAISGVYVGLFEGGSTASANSLLDTSSANVILTNGWYRADYANTAYGIRELTDQELAAQIRAEFLSYVNSSMPNNETYDKFLQTTNPTGTLMGTPPLKAISKCQVYQNPQNAGTTLVEITSANGRNNTTSPGVSQDDCTSAQVSANATYWNYLYAGNWKSSSSFKNGAIVSFNGSFYQSQNSVPSGSGDPSGDSTNWKKVFQQDFALGTAVWSVDGTQKAQSFNDWLSNVKATAGNWDSNITTYNVNLSAASCSPANADSTNGNDPSDAYTSFIANCWSPTWKTASHDNEAKNQTTTNTGWLNSLLTQATIARWTASNTDVFTFNNPYNRYICLNADGTDVEDGTYTDTLSGGDSGSPILVRAFNKDGSVNSKCPQSEYRAPIQGGLLGSGYDSTKANQNPGNDTRHISNFFGVSTVFLYPILLQPLANISQAMFTVGQFATQVANEVLTWTYMPILQSLGITNLVSSLIVGFRDTIFFPLSILFAAAGGIYILYQAGIKRRYREMFTSALYLALTFILGAALMANPSKMVNFVDTAPSNVEKTVMGIILAPTVGDNKLCSTGSTSTTSTSSSSWDNLDLGASTSNATSVNDLAKTGTYSSGDDALRQVLCANWEAFVYVPWVYAQWGTSPDNLDTSAMKNTNSALVGDAGVNLGGSNGEMHNWALYQLDTMKLGSSTTASWNLTGYNLKNKNFYRIVDMQAGPNNGAGTDSRYLYEWSGQDPMQRVTTGFTSMIVALFGSVTIIAYSFTKIVITLVSVLMLIFLPFVFLLGLFPTKRKFVKDYLLTILAMSIQRIALVLVLSLFLFFLLSALQGATNYLSVFLTAIIFCTIFMKFRKPILNYAMSAGGAGSNSFSNFASKASHWGTGMLGLDGVQALDQSWNQTSRAVNGMIAPRSLSDYIERKKSAVRYGTSGAVAGALTGQGIKKGWETAASPREEIRGRSQRRAGFGWVENSIRTAEQVSDSIKQDSRKSSNFTDAMADLRASLPEMQKYVDEMDVFQTKKDKFYDLAANTVGSRVETTSYIDENGQEAELQTLVAESTSHEEGEAPTREILMELKEPARPMLNGTPMEMEDIRIANSYRIANEKKKALVAQQQKLRSHLYSDSRDMNALDSLNGDSTPEEIAEAVKKAYPDASGFTDISRGKVTSTVSKLAAMEKKLASIEKEIDSIKAEYNRRNSKLDYQRSPEGVMLDIVNRVDSSINEMDSRGKN